ncbi:hypothetical protein KFZ56_05100 [Virgibacillus sp. NKC19-3]|uniref:acyl carrier protein n=1 Tax=Virgibacillus saliphilus TaxID=2831674 RepID=UPI001C9AABD3|nr:phosphopantetheine-binding protein [Virgibacillus sp. NKC19-3]MBY7142465.1 hypothetical protein [Virgibacillus sp. NKC19-3]
MESQELENRVRLIVKTCLNANEDFNSISIKDNLVDLGLDSIQGIKLLVLIEEQFEIEFFDEEYNLDYFKDIDSIITMVKKHISYYS